MPQFFPSFYVISKQKIRSLVTDKLVCYCHVDGLPGVHGPSDGPHEVNGPSDGPHETHGPRDGPLNSMDPEVIVPLCPPLLVALTIIPKNFKMMKQ